MRSGKASSNGSHDRDPAAVVGVCTLGSPEWVRMVQHAMKRRRIPAPVSDMTIDFIVVDPDNDTVNGEFRIRIKGGIIRDVASGTSSVSDVCLRIRRDIAAAIFVHGDGLAGERALYEGGLRVTGTLEALGPIRHWRCFSEDEVVREQIKRFTAAE